MSSKFKIIIIYVLFSSTSLIAQNAEITIDGGGASITIVANSYLIHDGSGKGDIIVNSGSSLTTWAPEAIINFNVSGDGDISLPVELSSFIANIESDKIILKWVTESEVHNSHFIIDKSIDEINFFTIANIPGQGNSTKKTEYKYEDVNAINGITYYYRLASCDYTGNLEYSDALSITFQNPYEIKPERFFIYQNYPNPFNPSTKIYFDLPKDVFVTINIYNLKGNLVKTILKQNIKTGNHEAIWNGTDDFGRKVSSGVYIYSIQTKNFTQSKKMILIN